MTKLQLNLGTLCLLFGAISCFPDGNITTRRTGDPLWANGILPYRYNSDFGARDQQDWVAAARYIQDRTCVRFRERQNGDRYWLDVNNGGCCSSYMGQLEYFKDKGQPIKFGGGHIQPFYLHEMTHALGFPHEQDRKDRDDFIYWDQDKTIPKCRENAQAGKYNDQDSRALETMFDYVSLMADWTECYWPKDNVAPKNIPLGPGGHDGRTLSVMDLERINAMYDCRGCYGYRFKNIDLRGSYQNPVEAGYELDGSKFYICRVYNQGHLLIGKAKPDSTSCWAAFEGGEGRYGGRFEVMTDPYNSGFRWQRKPGDNSIPRNAIKGGRTKDRENIYIARCLIRVDNRNTLIPGFVLESNGREARVPFGGGTRKCNDFEYLVCG